MKFSARFGLLFLLSACVPQAGSPIGEEGDLPDTNAETEVFQPLIIGGVDWMEITELSDDSAERINSRAVAYLSLPGAGTRCTGFLISQDVLMTNEHCVPRASAARGAVAYFARERGVSRSQWQAYRCDTFLGNDEALDFALLRCEGSPGAQQGVVNLEAHSERRGDDIYVIHQNCDYYTNPSCARDKKYSPGEIRRTGSYPRHNADTLGGSSGSPIFHGARHSVIAIHNTGYGNNGNGRGSSNGAVSMRRILPVIRQRFPDIQLGGQAPAPGIEKDALEMNDDESSATTISGAFSNDAMTIHSSDVDVFRVTLTSSASLSVQLSFVHARGDIDLSLHAGQLGSAAIASSASSDDDEQLQAELLPAGTYFVRVFGYNGATNSYSITVDPGQSAPVEPVEPAPGDNEPNNDIASAVSVPMPASISGLRIADASDVDFFTFRSEGGQASVRVDFSHADGDLDLELLDAQGVQVGQSNSVSDQEAVELELAAGAYFVRVYGYQGAMGDYSLTLQ